MSLEETLRVAFLSAMISTTMRWYYSEHRAKATLLYEAQAQTAPVLLFRALGEGSTSYLFVPQFQRKHHCPGIALREHGAKLRILTLRAIVARQPIC